ncbi:MAG: hypothetical protein PVH89_10480 [Gammaproteobacteria bacterium]|jgi:hypothetical protein
MKLRRPGSGGFDDGLGADDDADWPAAVRRLAARVEHGRAHEPRKLKRPRPKADEDPLKRVTRAKPWGVPN